MATSSINTVTQNQAITHDTLTTVKHLYAQPGRAAHAALLLLCCTVPVSISNAGEPVGGINVALQQIPGGHVNHGQQDIPSVPDSFFFPGSAPFDDVVDVCSTGEDDDCDGEVDEEFRVRFEPTDTNRYRAVVSDIRLRSVQTVTSGATAADQWSRDIYYLSDPDSDNDGLCDGTDLCDGTMVVGGTPGAETIGLLSVDIPLRAQFVQPGAQPSLSDPFLNTLLRLELTDPVMLERSATGELQIPNATALTFASTAGGLTFTGVGTAVPEPAGLSSLLLAAACLLVRRQRRQRGAR